MRGGSKRNPALATIVRMQIDPTPEFDVIVVGAGIAGAAIAYFLAGQARVLMLERESQPGYHSTGRSAAMFMESYGPPGVRELTRASRAFLERPPAGFVDGPLIRPRGALYFGSAAQQADLYTMLQTLQAEGCESRWLDGNATRALVPVLLPGVAAFGVLDVSATDVDVHALHQGYLRGAKAGGMVLRCDAAVTGCRFDGKAWQVRSSEQTWSARLLVNAAGAWADEVAALAGVPRIGLQPCRRSALVFEARVAEGAADRSYGEAIEHWPCVAPIDESFYFKPDAGLLLGSPANADPVPAHDVVPEELDIATAIHRIESATSLRIRRPRRTWAGLRSFTPDGEIRHGPDATQPHFVWSAGQGGYGIQTSAALGRRVAGQVLAALAATHG